MRCRPGPGLAHARIEAEVADQLARALEAADLADRGQKLAATITFTPGTLINRLISGKSRLALEALASIGVPVVRGRCLPYGEAITYWPVVEALRQLELSPPDEAAAATIRSLREERGSAATGDEVGWAFRKTLEHAAATQALVVVLDDIDWVEEALLDLVEHVALLSSGAAILPLCMARPELLERPATWPVTVRLEPLSDEEVDRLLSEHIADRLRKTIARSAGGNLLFIQEMLALTGNGEGERRGRGLGRHVGPRATQPRRGARRADPRRGSFVREL